MDRSEQLQKPVNPYSPGAGTRPPVLAGRDAQLALVRSVADQVEAGREANPLVYTGLRGMGKTALLKETIDELRRRKWLAGYYEVRRDVDPGAAVASIVEEGSRLAGRSLRKALTSGVHRLGRTRLTVGPTGVSLEIDPGNSVAGAPVDAYPALVALLRDLGGSARGAGAGVALVVDELQVFRKRDLAVLIQALSATKELPIVLIGAGLPYLPSEMSKANTYAERFRYESVDGLRDSDIRLAVIEPAEQAGVTWDSRAVDRLVELSLGYPYFVQLYASESWKAAGDAATISAENVESAIDPVQHQLDIGLYAARYERLSGTERAYVHAVVHTMDQERPKTLFGAQAPSERVGSGDVAANLGKSINAAAPTRDRVIRKGVIHSPQFGLLEFSVPGFATYVRRRMGSDEL